MLRHLIPLFPLCFTSLIAQDVVPLRDAAPEKYKKAALTRPKPTVVTPIHGQPQPHEQMINRLADSGGGVQKTREPPFMEEELEKNTGVPKKK